MLGKSLMFAVLAVSAPAIAEEATDKGSSQAETPAAAEPDSTPAPAESASAASTADTAAKPEASPQAPREDWHMETHGYFRAPMSIGISSRPNPDTPNGPSNLQWSYAPNRVMDWSYYSFAYTRLQEQDWAELTFHAKKKHVDAAMGWMGYWLAASGFRNADAAATPGVAYLTLDTDFELAGLTPNIALTMGAWWPGFGYFEKYDTFTLGRFRQIGEQAKLTVPLNSDITVSLIEGFGTGRDGSFKYTVATNDPLYASQVGDDLIAWTNLGFKYKNVADVSLHYSYEWTRDPRLSAEASPSDGKTYSKVADAHLSVAGAEANVLLGVLGRVWISPSYLSVKNGWALAGGGGTEVMHSQNGMGIATNFMAWSGNTDNSTGSGTMLNLGFLYENTLSGILGKAPSSPDLRLNIFGLLADSKLDLPSTTKTAPTGIKQFKYGADVTLQALDWLAFMLRGDTVNYDLDHGGYIFSAITARLSVASHFLSSESIYLQFSRYIYGDNMVMAQQWPWGTDLVAGSRQLQAIGDYGGQRPDQWVLKMQASVAF